MFRAVAIEKLEEAPGKSAFDDAFVKHEKHINLNTSVKQKKEKYQRPFKHSQ